VQFDCDDGNRGKCRKHGLSEAEIEYALNHGARFAPDPEGGRGEARCGAGSMRQRLNILKRQAISRPPWGAGSGANRIASDPGWLRRMVRALHSGV
jgi:hypothetical protein